MNTEPTIQTYRGDSAAPDHDAAMLAADGMRRWHDLPLQAWDLLRESHWLAMRGVASAPPLRGLLERPGAFLADALRILWLASLDDAALRRAARGDMQADCDGWAAAHVPLREAGAAITLALDLYNDAHANDVEPAPRPGLDDPDPEGRRPLD